MAARPMGPSPTNQQNSRQSSNGVTRNHKGQGEESSHPPQPATLPGKGFLSSLTQGAGKGSRKGSWITGMSRRNSFQGMLAGWRD